NAMTYISTNWQDTDLSQEACLDRAERTIKKADFKALSHTTYSRHGTRGEYTVQIRCAEEKSIVIFIVSGPSNRTGDYLETVTKAFGDGYLRPQPRQRPVRFAHGVMNVDRLQDRDRRRRARRPRSGECAAKVRDRARGVRGRAGAGRDRRRRQCEPTGR